VTSNTFRAYPLGSKGTLEGKPVEVIGFLVKQSRSTASPTTGANICWPDGKWRPTAG
jgi:hypothetical protein